MAKHFDVIIVGGGQSGLACGYFMRRTDLSYVILDEQLQPGGAWNQTWDSLRLFSPAEHSSLPGWLMPKDDTEYPGKEHVIDYISRYKERYNLPVCYGVEVENVQWQDGLFHLNTSGDSYTCRALISATGTWKKPYIPDYPGQKTFKGLQVHSAYYKNPDDYKGKKVLIVGGGNSGAQLIAELSKIADTKWVTIKEPKLLPEHVDGRYLFEFATKQYKARLEGKKIEPAGSLGDVVMVDSVKDAKSRDALQTVRPFLEFHEEGVIWNDGTKEKTDAVIWCTGFKPALDHLQGLEVVNNDKVATKGTKSAKQDGLWLVGYGNWTGYASATLIGVGRTARQTVKEVEEFLR